METFLAVCWSWFQNQGNLDQDFNSQAVTQFCKRFNFHLTLTENRSHADSLLCSRAPQCECNVLFYFSQRFVWGAS